MAILFMGGEDVDFQLPMNGFTFDILASVRRADFSRVSLRLEPTPSSLPEYSLVAYGALTARAAALWMTARITFAPTDTTPGGSKDIVTLYDGYTKRISLRHYGAGVLRVVQFNDSGAITILGTATGSIGAFTMARYDLQVGIGQAGVVRLYVNSNLVLDYAGPVVPGSSTSVDRFGFQNPGVSNNFYVNETIVADEDTRLLSLKVHPAQATGTFSNWTGGVAHINEATADGNYLRTTAPNTVSTFTTEDAPANQQAVYAVKVVARVARGESGPPNASLMIKGGASVSEGLTQPVDTGWTNISQTWHKNPLTNTDWTVTEVNASEIGIKSKS